MWFCEACKKDILNRSKSSHKCPETYIENEVSSRRNNNPTDDIKTYLNPDFDQVDGLVTGTIDQCSQFFHRFK